MAITVDDLKKYLRIDGDEEDELLEVFIGTAITYISGAVDGYFTRYAKYPEFAAKADMLTAIWAAEYYQNRANEEHDMSFAATALMKQLQYFPVDTFVDDTLSAPIDTVDAESAGTLAMFDGNGNLFNSGVRLATDADAAQLLDEVGLTVEGGG